MPSKRKIASLLIQAAMLVACVSYVFTDIDWRSLLGMFTEYSPIKIIGVLAVTIPFYWLMGLRLKQMSEGKISTKLGLLGSFLAVGFNNLLPARLGEVTKAVYLTRKTEVTFGEVMGIIFLERFLDINIVAISALAATMLLGLGAYGLPIVGAVCVCWVVLFVLVRKVPETGVNLTFIPWERVREFACTLLFSLKQAMRGHVIVFPMVNTVILWAVNFAYLALIPLWLMSLDFTSAQVVGIIATIYIGLAIPGTPGGLGVTEGAIVAFLVWSGIPKTEALAVALTIRAFNFVPTTLLGLTTFATSGFSWSALTQKESV